MKDLTILIGWHNEKDPEKIKAFEKNRKSFIDYNPGVDVITVINPIEDKYMAWLSPDLSMFLWYKENGKSNNSKRYLIVEWDCWCNCDMREYFKIVWDCDYVVPYVLYPNRDIEWCWFSTINELPEESKKYATGGILFCMNFLSDKMMRKVCDEILKPKYKNLICELRLPTIATMLGIDPIPMPAYTRTIKLVDEGCPTNNRKGIHHPRKKVKEDFVILLINPNESDLNKIKVYEKNKQTFIDHNPDVKIFTISNVRFEYNEMYYFQDLIFINWYIENYENLNSERFLIVDNECWCDCNIKEYFKMVWEFDYVATSVKYYERKDGWHWFNFINDLPEEARVYATGTPIYGTLLSDRAIKAISQEIIKTKYHNVISELRLPTVASMLGFDPISNPVCNKSLNWKRLDSIEIGNKGIHRFPLVL